MSFCCLSARCTITIFGIPITEHNIQKKLITKSMVKYWTIKNTRHCQIHSIKTPLNSLFFLFFLPKHNIHYIMNRIKECIFQLMIVIDFDENQSR